MLLIPSINIKGDLSLDAYSFSSEEIDCVAYVLDKSKIKIEVKELTKDQTGRFGIRFFVLAIEINKLERTLNLKFQGSEKETTIKMGEVWSNYTGGGPSSYKCSALNPPPHGCKTIYADDDKEAVVLCGLVANENNWLGGLTNRGKC